MRKWLLLLFLSIFASAQIKIISVKVSSYGATQSEAIENALVRAIQQVNGLSINSARAIVRQSTKGKILFNNSKSIIKVTTKSQANAIATKSSGAIESYKILSLKKAADGYKTELLVYVAKYKSPGLNPRNRRSLAVLPFEYKKTYSIYGIDIDGKALSERITQSIVNKITQTRKFTVLDRQNSKYYEFEKNFLLSVNTEPSELARLGKRLGADYFIIGQILDFGVDKKVSSNYYTGQVNSKNLAYATISYRILNIPTQQIKWSDTIDIEFSLPTSKRAESIISKAGDKIAQILAEQIIFNIYPPKVIEISGNKAVINMGGNVLHKGDVFKVYALGKKLYDPYTKEYLGRDEIDIGKVEIIAVKPKISYAKVVSGTIKKGAILRKAQAENKNQQSSPDGEKESMFEMMFSK